ncbi:AAA family ATPase [Aquibacillus halophilus]|uniref:AAA family ATPase n=1 Tax=Aquibacillus halophilus TaxID=930132 RepID=A0A6A8DK30_9BACI|nr:AAA family ATPase [Aquibacillus halophilus]MRH44119.1 AAA family ATPase [Aquibacillus halophilus]
MKILSANIYGFGKWQDEQLNFGDKQLVIISGENESGKSTLRQYMLFMFFGLPPKKREFYFPKTGGKMGGRLTVSTQTHGEFTIERIHDRNNGEAECFFPDGTIENEKWLKESMTGIDYSSFQSIFSFDSNDLNKLHTLKADQLGEVLLGIGMTGSDQIYKTEKHLDNQLNQLFKPQGKKPEVNEQLMKIEEINKQLNELKVEENSYHEKQSLKEIISEEIVNLQQELAASRKKQTSIETKIQVSPLLTELHHANQQLFQYEDPSEFPENGVERYQHIKEQLLPLQSEYSVLHDNEQKYESELGSLKKQVWDSELFNKANVVLERARNYNHSGNEMEYHITEKDSIARELTKDLEQLQVGVELEDLRDLKLPFHVEEEWNQLKQEKSQLFMELEKVDSELKSILHQIKHVGDRNEHIKAKLVSQEKIDQYNQKVSDYDNQTKAQMFNEFNIDQKRKWQKESKERDKRSNIVIAVGSLFSIALGAFAFVAEIDSLLIASILLFVGVVIQKLVVAQSNRRTEKIFGKTDTVTRSQPKQEEIHIKEMKQTLSDQQTFQYELKNGEADYQKLYIEQIKLEEKEHFYRIKQKRLEKRVNEQTDIFSFLNLVHIDYWPKLYHILSNSVLKWNKYSHLESEIEKLQLTLNHYEEEIVLFLEENQLIVEELPINEKVNHLKRLIEKQMGLNNNIEQYTKWLNEVYDLQRNLILRMKPYHEEIANLWNLARVEDEEVFLKKGNNKKSREKLESRISEIKDQLTPLLGESGFKIALASKPDEKEDLLQEVRDIKQYIDEVEASIEDKRQSLSDVKSLLVKMENKEDYSIVKHQFHLEQDYLKSLTKQWAIHQVSKQILLETKQIFQNNYLPKVIESTSYYFNLLTGGRYINVFSPKSGNPMQVENNLGIRFNVNQLSQGTNDQLYISLRIALSEIVNKQYKLPFFIDDAFVHFDKSRTKEMIRILNKLATNQQIILFTCQDSLQLYVENEKNVHLQVL